MNVPQPVTACLLRIAASAILAAALALPASLDYSSRAWGMQDGLPDGRIQAISQTADGYLWIGTSGGLVRFDGIRFAVFDRSNTPAFGDDSVLSLFTAKDGTLWIGTEGGGLVRYAGGKFVRYSREHGLTNLFIRGITEDDTGKLWVGTDRGLFLRKDQSFQKVDSSREIPFVAGHVQKDFSGRVWVTGNGLYRVEDGHIVLVNASFQRGGRAIHERPDGRLWLATTHGMFEVNGSVLRPILPSVSAPTRMLTGTDGVTWIGASNGLFLARSEQTTLSREDLPGSSVLALFRDREDNIWVGTTGGLTRFSKKLVTTVKEDGIGNDGALGIYKDPRHRLWLVSGEGGLYEISAQRLIRKRISGLPLGARVRTVFEDRRGCFWIGTGNSGFYRSGCGAVTVYDMSTGLRNDDIRAFLQDRAGALWIATGSGLARLEGESLKVYYTDQGLAYGSVRSLVEGQNGDLWVGTDGGISRMRQGKFLSDKVVGAFAGERIWSLYEDADGAIWVGTRGRGLFRIRAERVSELGTMQGLPKSIHQILEDTSGSIWLSGPSGVVCTSRNKLNEAADGRGGLLKIRSYGSAEGMRSPQMSGGVQPAGAISLAGEAWFPNVHGAVVIKTGVAPPVNVPFAIVEDVLVGGQHVNFANGVQVPAGADRLEFAFTAPSLRSPEKLAFSYKLEGFDRDWTSAAASRIASYTSLRPGRYNFRLIVRNLAAPDEPAETSVGVVWNPYFFETRSAFVLAVFALAALVWLIFRVYARQTRQRYALLLSERARVAREMHDTVIQGCVGVSTLLEAASSFPAANKPIVSELINRARSELRITLEEARLAVWDLRHDSVGGKLLETLSAFAQQLSAESGVPIEVEIAGTPISLETETDRNLLAAAREAVRNAVAHGKPQRVRVVVSYAPEHVRIEVIDDGIGFEADSLRIAAGHYGLLGMRERMERLGGSLRLISHEAQGTRVIAELPLGGGRT